MRDPLHALRAQREEIAAELTELQTQIQLTNAALQHTADPLELSELQDRRKSLVIRARELQRGIRKVNKHIKHENARDVLKDSLCDMRDTPAVLRAASNLLCKIPRENLTKDEWAFVQALQLLATGRVPRRRDAKLDLYLLMQKGEEARKQVESWPKWKREIAEGYFVTRRPHKEDSDE